MAVSKIQTSVDRLSDKVVGNVRYVKGFYQIAHGDTMLHRIQDFIDVLEDSTTVCCFDVILNASGQFRFSGYLYPGKMYGAGVTYAYGGYMSFWNRDNGNDIIKNVSLVST